MTRTEISSKLGLQVVDHLPTVITAFPSNYRDFAVGTVHKPWGWLTVLKHAREAALSSQQE